MSAANEALSPPARGPRNALFAVAAGVLVAWALIAVLAPLLVPHDPTDFVSDDPFAAPSRIAWLGTDYLGRDLFSRLIAGARISLFMAFLATLLAHLLGGTLGLMAAVRGGLFDAAVSRIVDIALSLPKIIVGLVVVAAIGTSMTVLVIVAGLVYAAGVFRIARALGADVAVMDFIRAARARGEGAAWLIFGEILPNIIMPLAADFAIRMSFAILFMSSLSFIGLGVQPPRADWGGLVRENLSALSAGSWAPIFPALAIASVAIALNLLVDAIGDRRQLARIRDE
ncbi:MAG TPA: ABC transporter permease [Stellaceae bacterium]|nr:ABC transporter permease [Stellaceae bacterium]